LALENVAILLAICDMQKLLLRETIAPLHAVQAGARWFASQQACGFAATMAELGGQRRGRSNRGLGMLDNKLREYLKGSEKQRKELAETS
jgi:hypothetical protein